MGAKQYMYKKIPKLYPNSYNKISFVGSGVMIDEHHTRRGATSHGVYIDTDHASSIQKKRS